MNDGFVKDMVPTFKSEDKFLQCDHLNETSFTVLLFFAYLFFSINIAKGNLDILFYSSDSQIQSALIMLSKYIVNK